MKKYKEQLHNNIDGGLAHNMNPQDIADKHKVDISVILTQLEKGIEVEYEHTYNTEIAKEIAMDHLVEYPYYYDELEKMEKKFENIKGKKMERYKRKFKEEDDANNNGIPDWLDDKISEVLQELRDGNFGNAAGRQEFLDLVTTLFNSKDRRARKAFKAISGLFTDIGDELLKYGQPEELKERKFEESLGTNLLMKSKLSNEEIAAVLKSAGHGQAGMYKNDRQYLVNYMYGILDGTIKG